MSSHDACLRKIIGADDDTNTSPTLACHKRVVRLAQLKDSMARSILHVEAAFGSVECLQTLLEAGAPASQQDPDGRSAIHYAAAGGNTECASLLIDANYDLVSVRDRSGCTALHLAAQYGHGHLISFLLGSMADANARNVYGQTPLHLVTSAMALQALLEGGGDLGAVDSQGFLPIHCAAASSSMDVLQNIVYNHPVHINSTDSVGGRSALHIAADAGHSEACTLLLSAGSIANAFDTICNAE
jgi:ankyrin repeat protein